MPRAKYRWKRIRQLQTTATCHASLVRRFNGIGRITVRETQLTLATVAGNMRRGMYNNACMAYEQSQENREANVSGGESHFYYDC